MLKKILVHQLSVGMYVKEFCGSWLDHPFWRGSFLISDPKEIEAIQASRIKELWIDCSKGADLDSGEASATEPQTIPEVEAELEAKRPLKRKTESQSTADELERAAKICARSREAVVSMFQEARMGKAIDTGKAQFVVEEVSDSIARNPHALISLARLKTADNYTYMHSVSVSALMVALAHQMDLSEEGVRYAGIAGLMHDLGKVATPLELLNKPGKLSDEEFRIMRRHPEDGYRMLRSNSDLSEIMLDVCLHHHEKTDGSGYPEGATGKKISLFARMCAVCDVYDALTSERPYKSAWDPALSLRKMAEWADGHFDSAVLHAFVKSLGIYPIGSLVELNSGRIGIVVNQSPSSLLTPCIKVFYSTRANERIRPEIVDLSRSGCREKISRRADPTQWNFHDLHLLCSGMTASNL